MSISQTTQYGVAHANQEKGIYKYLSNDNNSH